VGGKMNFFDSSIISFINGFSRTSWALDQTINLFAHTGLFKGGILTIVIWWAWFKKDNRDENRRILIATLLSSVLVIFLARSLALTLPFRIRPLNNPELTFQLPYGVLTGGMETWSSFPSDHTALLFGLVTGIFFISRTLGILISIHLFFLIVLVRIYLGLHYPTDLLAGAALGILITLVAIKTPILAFFTRFSLRLHDNKPALFYPILFFFTYQIATMFIDLRDLGSSAFKYAKLLTGLT
jgi:undecaprenyl-diphosphatase